MKQIVRTLIVLSAVLLLAAPAAAQANFGKYVALGDSLTAGFLNGGLLDDAQERSYPALLARQAGVADFQLPLAGAPGIPPLLAIQGFNGGTPIITPRAAQPGPPRNLTLPRPYDNLAVPGFDTGQALSTISDPANPLSDLILRGLGTQLEQAIVQQPTFATVWLGNNDVLGAATSGIVIDGVTLTPVAEFTQAYRTILGALASRGVQLAVANIPNVTALPFVTTVPPVVVNPATGQPVTGPGGAPVFLIGQNGPLGPGDRVLLTATALLAQGIGIPAQLGGTGQPLPDNAYLSAAEIGVISARINAYNAVIAQAAADFGAALVDINGFFNGVVANGYPAGGNIVLTTSFLTGGIFSYDGVHPNPVAYAVVANLFIDAINTRFNDSIPHVDLIPFLFGPDGSAGATVPLPGLGEGTPVFSGAAYEGLRTGLGVPPTDELLRLKEQRRPPRGDAPGGGLRPDGTPSRQPAGPGLRVIGSGG